MRSLRDASMLSSMNIAFRIQFVMYIWTSSSSPPACLRRSKIHRPSVAVANMY